MAGKGSGTFLGGVLLGGAIGAIAGMWIDPRTTRRVRRAVQETVDQLPEFAHQVGDTTIQLSDRLRRRVTNLSHNLQDDWHETSERLRDAAVAGWDASRREYRSVINQHADQDFDTTNQIE
ncbi:MAG: YtxH domain-containing protein [Oscillatoriales cyanobacterium]|jgi:gas vesicle protein|nr:MAG: YtxH domain-containing protein [Oscillatoriales cyanobacterium]